MSYIFECVAAMGAKSYKEENIERAYTEYKKRGKFLY
jgi:hypothetical protein